MPGFQVGAFAVLPSCLMFVLLVYLKIQWYENKISLSPSPPHGDLVQQHNNNNNLTKCDLLEVGFCVVCISKSPDRRQHALKNKVTLVILVCFILTLPL